MKKRLGLLLLCVLALTLLAGCGDESARAPELVNLVEATKKVTMEPQPTLAPEITIAPKDPSENGIDTMDQAPAADAVVTPEPAPAVTANAVRMSYVSLEDTSLGFTFEYPLGWQNKPGVFTMCFTEADSEKPFPMRVAITKKKLVHTPSEETKTDQLKEYLKVIYKQYDKATFQVSSLNTEIRFLDQPGFSTTYMAFKDDIEVKGFVIAANVERNLYVFHFCGSYADYTANESAMWYMLNSATTQLEPENP